MLAGQCKPVNVRSEHRSVYVYTAPAPKSTPKLLKKRRTSRDASAARARKEPTIRAASPASSSPPGPDVFLSLALESDEARP